MVHRIAVLVALAGCHVVVRSETVHRGAAERVVHREGAIARRPTVVLTDAGMLRFVEPLECPSEEIVVPQRTIERATRPSYATFTVGVIATAVGGVLLVSGLFDRSPGKSPLTYAGAGAIGAGLPLAVGPWLGNRVDLVDAPALPPERHPGASVACGERALAATSATLQVGALEIHGAVDRDGVFEISPYRWVDAFAPNAAAAVALSGRVEAAGGARSVEVVLEPAALAAHAPAFLAHADFDARIEPLEHVPALAAGIVRASLTSIGERPALRVVLPVSNAGPGDAWALRGELVAPAVPAIDGRILYVGHVAAKATVTRELVIPLTAEAAAALRGSTLELAIELHDAHGTAPALPATFRGAVLGDLPRP